MTLVRNTFTSNNRIDEMKHVRKVAILCFLLSGLLTTVLSGCGGDDPTVGQPMPVDEAEKEFSDGE